MAEHRTVSVDEDPVCGMTVDPEQARAKGLAITYDDPEPFLAPGYVASM